MIPKINCHIIYVLGLEDNCYYVGWTTSFAFKKRMANHWRQTDKGSMWTRAHKPIKIVEIDNYPRYVPEPDIARLEDKKTLEYARIHGLGVVRGGGYCQEYPDWPLDMGKPKKKKKKLKSNKQLRELARAKRELRVSAKLII